MPFPSASARASLAQGLTDAQNRAAHLKSLSTNTAAAMAAGPTSATIVLTTLSSLLGVKARLDAIAALPGMGPFAVEQLGQDVTFDFTAMSNAVDAVVAWIIANLPRAGGTGYLLVETMDAAGNRVPRMFTVAEMAPLKTRLDTLAATIA